MITLKISKCRDYSFFNPEFFGIHKIFPQILVILCCRLDTCWLIWWSAWPETHHCYVFSVLFLSQKHIAVISDARAYLHTYIHILHPANVLPVSSGPVRGSRRINCFAIQHPKFPSSRVILNLLCSIVCVCLACPSWVFSFYIYICNIECKLQNNFF